MYIIKREREREREREIEQKADRTIEHASKSFSIHVFLFLCETIDFFDSHLSVDERRWFRYFRRCIGFSEIK